MSTSAPMAGDPQAGARNGGAFLRKIVPGLSVFSAKGLRGIRYDAIAAITLAAYILPAGLGDATLAGLPPESGLYACLFSGMVFWLFCSSKQTTVTVTSAISLLIGSSLGGLAEGDADRYAALAECTAVLVGAIALLAWIVRAGVLVNFISETVMIGFKAGVAIYLASTQLPKLFGFKGSHGNFWERIGHFFWHIQETNPLALAFGLIALTLILAGKVYLKNKPVALFVMIGAIVAASVMHLGDRGVSLLGEIPQGLPQIRLPVVSWSDMNDLLPVAMACFLLGAVETAAIGRTFAVEHGYRLDSNQEFLALAAANLAAGLGRGYPVSGGMSQSLVNESAGARSPFSGFLAACIILLVTIFLSGLLRNLPQPVLAAIVLAAITGLVKIPSLKELWRFSRGEFVVAMVALLGVLGSGLLRGVLFGAILTILLVLRRASRPHATELGRVPGASYFADCRRHAENERIPGVFVFRVDSSLFYFNVEHVRDRFMEMLKERGDEIRVVIFFLGTVPTVDLAGAELLAELFGTMKARGVEFRIAEAHGSVRDALRRAGFEKLHGPIEANQTVSEVLSQIGEPHVTGSIEAKAASPWRPQS
jgi:sulfate permease, SulP family